MSHARPLPDAAVAPYPPHPAPIVHHDKPAEPAAKAEPKAVTPSKWLAAGIGVGIGSAAIVAALLYSNYENRRK